MRITDSVIRDYLLFRINSKEIKGRSWRNRKASDFYRYLKTNSNLYNITILQALKRDAYFVMKKIWLPLSEL